MFMTYNNNNNGYWSSAQRMKSEHTVGNILINNVLILLLVKLEFMDIMDFDICFYSCVDSVSVPSPKMSKQMFYHINVTQNSKLVQNCQTPIIVLFRHMQFGQH